MMRRNRSACNHKVAALLVLWPLSCCTTCFNTESALQILLLIGTDNPLHENEHARHPCEENGEHVESHVYAPRTLLCTKIISVRLFFCWRWKGTAAITSSVLYSGCKHHHQPLR